jgi:hypothetical protein
MKYTHVREWAVHIDLLDQVALAIDRVPVQLTAHLHQVVVRVQAHH